MPLGQIDAIRNFKPVTPAESRVAVAGMNFDEILAMMPKKTTGILESNKGSNDIGAIPRLHTSQSGSGCSLGRSKIGEAYGNPRKPEPTIDMHI